LIRLCRRAILPLLALLLIVGLVAPHVWAWHHLRQARAELACGHNAAAARHLRASRSIHPNDPEAILLAAQVARRSGAWDDAEAFLDQYTQLNGEDEPLVFERLLMRACRGELESTNALLDARIAAGGRDARLAREAIATGLLYRYHWAQAEDYLKAWLAATPDDPFALLLQGQLLEQRNLTSLAVIAYRQVVELDPEQLEARLRLATLLLQLRQGEEALTNLSYLREQLPDNPEIHVQWVRALALQGHTDKARAALEECLRLHPNYPLALAERGNFALLDGEEVAAEEYFARALRFDPGDLQIRNQYALALARNGKAAEAAKERDEVKRMEADYQKIAQLSQGPLQARPNDPAIPHEIGVIAFQSGQFTEALRWFRLALQIDPDHLPTHRSLVTYYRATDAPALAAKHRAIAQRLAQQAQP
jgi:tetratricopeptide (TPR) repeat protein